MKTLHIQYKTTKDYCGNPRRLRLIYNFEGELLAMVKHCYSSTWSHFVNPEYLTDVVELHSETQIPYGEYTRLMKEHSNLVVEGY